MISGKLCDKDRIVDIISDSFDENKSTNFVVKQDIKRKKRLRGLIEYSVLQGEAFGKIFMSNDKNGACIVLFPRSKKMTIQALIWNVRLIFKVIGLNNLFKVIKKEKLLKKNHPKTPFYHLWYIGVDPNFQDKGIGSKLLQEVLEFCNDRPIYLETSVVANLDWYARYGFKIINVLNFDYKLYVLKKE